MSASAASFGVAKVLWLCVDVWEGCCCDRKGKQQSSASAHGTAMTESLPNAFHPDEFIFLEFI